MSLDNNNRLSISESNEHFSSNDEQNHLTLVSNNNEISDMESIKAYLKLVEDSVNMLFMTAMLEAQIKNDRFNNIS